MLTSLLQVKHPWALKYHEFRGRECHPEIAPLGRLTPGITRRPAGLPEFKKRRVGGQVHAVVRRDVRFTAP